MRSKAVENMEAFQLAATRVLPAAITVENEGYERYAIGSIVYHSAKPTIVSWRKQNIQLAHSADGDAVTLARILNPDCTRLLSQLRPQSTLFASTGKRETTREFTVSNYQGAGRVATVKAAFGAIYQTTSNLIGILDSTSGRLKADTDHPVVQKVLENGGHCFVVSTLYEAEKVDISVKEGKEVPQWRSVFSKPNKTVLAILLMRLFIKSDGAIRPVRHGGYTPSSMEESGDGAEQGGDFEDVDSAYMRYQCGCRELQVFRSDTYAGVIDEAAEFVKALTRNGALQNAFITVIQTPGNSLQKLSKELHALQERLVTQSGERGSDTSFPELIGHLSTPSPHTLDQVKALTIATEAFRELSPVTTKRILSLTASERKMLFDLFMQLPLGHSAHTFFRPALPETDFVYSQILMKIGFGSSRGNLSYEAEECDMVAVVITAIQATTASQ